MAYQFQDHAEWWEAVAREREIRESAYLGLTTPVAGGAIALPPLTLRRQMFLYADRNPLVCGGEADEADAVAFLWLLDGAYAADNQEGRKSFYLTLGALNLSWPHIIAELRAFVEESNFDAPVPKGRSGLAPGICAAAEYVNLFAREYGWSRDQILDSPVACLHQEERAINRRAQSARGKPTAFPPGHLVAKVERAIVDAARAKAREEAIP